MKIIAHEYIPGDWELGGELQGHPELFYIRESIHKVDCLFLPCSPDFNVVIYSKSYELSDLPGLPWHITREIALHEATGVQMYYGHFKE